MSNVFTKLISDINILGTHIYNDIKSTGVYDAIDSIVKSDLQSATPLIMSDLQNGSELFAQGASDGVKAFADSLSVNMTAEQKQAVQNAFLSCEKEAADLSRQVWATDMRSTINEVADDLAKAIQDKGSFDATWLAGEIFLELNSGINQSAIQVIAGMAFNDIKHDALDAAEANGAIISPTGKQIDKFYSGLEDQVYNRLNNVTTILENEINPRIDKIESDVNNVIAAYIPNMIKAIQSDFATIPSGLSSSAKQIISVVKTVISLVKSIFKKFKLF
ncbi:MAG: hypothetical protein WCV63_09315 [Negativicutes bacterium]